MKCPVCKQTQNVEIDLRAEGFNEDICECRLCGAAWSVNHGLVEIIRDPQEKSFLAAASEKVEGDDYNCVGN